jgi:hypothetical protein
MEVLMKALRNTLLALAVYMTVVGALFLFAPGIAEKAFSTSLPDRALTPLYGELMIVIALMAYLVSTDVSAYKKLVIAFIVSEIGHVLIFGYQLMSGISTFAQVGPPMIIAIIFTVLLFVFRGKA